MAGTNRYIWGLALYVTMGTFIYGYDSGIVTITISKPSWFDYMDEPSPAYVGGVASVYSAGQAIGCLLQVFLADCIGRVRFLMITSVILLTGIGVQSGAVSMAMFIAGRAVSGFAAGGTYLTTTIYLCEIAPKKTRGMVAGCSGLSIGLGIMVSSWIGVACSYAPYSSLQWRLPIALQAPFPILLLVGLTTFIPESPRHLLNHAQDSSSRNNYIHIHRTLHPYDRRKAFNRMRAQIDFERLRQNNLTPCELYRLFRSRVGVAFTTGVMTSFTGAQVVGYYQVRLYQTLGIELGLRLILAGVYGSVCFLSVAVTDKFVLDRWGRRNLILLGLIGCIVAQIYCAVMQWRFEGTMNVVGKGFAVGGIYLLTAVHYAAFGSSTGIYQAEVLPIAIRSKVMGVIGFASFATMTGLTEAAPSAFVTIRHNYYYVFVGTTFVCLVIAWIWFPETKHKTLEDLAALFGDSVVTVVEVDEKDTVQGRLRMMGRMPAVEGYQAV